MRNRSFSSSDELPEEELEEDEDVFLDLVLWEGDLERAGEKLLVGDLGDSRLELNGLLGKGLSLVGDPKDVGLFSLGRDV